MAKKERTSILRVILVLAVIVCGVVAALALLGPGLSLTTDVIEQEISGFGMIFGGGPIVTTSNILIETTYEIAYEGGMSYLGLASFICLALGVVCAVLALFKKSQGLRFCTAILFAAAAILMIFLPNLTSEVTVLDLDLLSGDVDFTVYDLGAGAISYITFAGVGAIVSLVSCIFRK